MTHDHLVKIAKRRGLVQWHPSGLVEETRLFDQSPLSLQRKLQSLGVKVVVRAILRGDLRAQGRWRPIYPLTKEGGPRNFHFREVSPSTPIEVGLMIERTA